MLLFPYTIGKRSKLGYDNYIYILKQNFKVEVCRGLDYVPTMWEVWSIQPELNEIGTEHSTRKIYLLQEEARKWNNFNDHGPLESL